MGDCIYAHHTLSINHLFRFIRASKTSRAKMPAPPISALEQLKKLDPKQVQGLRERFLAEANQSPELYEKADLDTIGDNSWQVERFLLESKLNTENALKALHNAMQWRKTQQIHQMRIDDFPAEYYQSGYIVQYGRDVHEAKIIYFRANIHRKTSEWNELLKKFFIYQIEQADLYNDGKGMLHISIITSILSKRSFFKVSPW